MKRKDGTRYRGADMLYTIVPFIMVKRSDACNALTVHLPYNSMHDYIAAKRAQGVNLSYMTFLSPLMCAPWQNIPRLTVL